MQRFIASTTKEEKRLWAWLHKGDPGCLSEIQELVKLTLASRPCNPSRHFARSVRSRARKPSASGAPIMQLPAGRLLVAAMMLCHAMHIDNCSTDTLEDFEGIFVSRFCISSRHLRSSMRSQACKRSASDAHVMQFLSGACYEALHIPTSPTPRACHLAIARQAQHRRSASRPGCAWRILSALTRCSICSRGSA